jgi:cyclic-di-GMP phosphodiesterase TipF (flagellum assembly factor)
VRNRTESALVFLAITTVSFSVAVTLWSGLSVSWPVAALFGMGVATVLTAFAVLGQRQNSLDAKAEARMAGLEAKLQEMEASGKALAERIEHLDKALVDYSRMTVEAVASEFNVMGSVVRDLAQTVAVHDAELFATPREEQALPVEEPLSRIPPEAAVFTGQRAPRRPSPAVAEALLEAIRSERLDVELQPVVTLPQRRVAYYEMQLRGPAPATMAELCALAEERGTARRLDAFTLGHVVSIARHLAGRGRDIPVLCTLTGRALIEPTMFEILSAIARQDRTLPGRIVLQFAQETVRRLGPIETEALEAIRGLGFRFSLADPQDLRLDPAALAGQGFRLVKVPAASLIDAAQGGLATDIHPADLSGLLARSGVSFIVDGIDDDAILAELGEFEIGLAQGVLFGPGRPVRLDVLGEPPAPPAAPSPPQASSSPAGPSGGLAKRPAAAPAEAVEPPPPPSGERRSLRSVLRRGGA